MSCPCLVKLDLARIFARKSSQLKFLKALKKNKKLILKNASILYKQKTKENELYSSNNNIPGYLKTVVDFKYAEDVFDKFLILNNMKTD